MKTLPLLITLFIYSFKGGLSWKDFKGVPYGDEKVLALTSWNINLSIDQDGNKISYTVTPEFISERSFTRTSDSAVLAHENYHYRLVELFAAKIQRAIQPYQNKSYSPKPERIYENLCASLCNTQDLYDKESRHGNNKSTQHQWEINIDKEIAKLK